MISSSVSRVEKNQAERSKEGGHTEFVGPLFHLRRVWTRFGTLPLLLCLCCAPSKAAQSPSGQTESQGDRVTEVTDSRPLLGREICFNGWDDNDNRLIDEGCDVFQGKVQFVLAWPDPHVDLDLLVTDPACQVAPLGRATETGLTRSVDCPSDTANCAGQNLENVYLDGLPLVSGAYQVRVRVEKMSADVSPIKAQLGVRYPGATRAFELFLRQTGEEVVLTFEVQGDEALEPSGAEKKLEGKKKDLPCAHPPDPDSVASTGQASRVMR